MRSSKLFGDEKQRLMELVPWYRRKTQKRTINTTCRPVRETIQDRLEHVAELVSISCTSDIVITLSKATDSTCVRTIFIFASAFVKSVFLLSLKSVSFWLWNFLYDYLCVVLESFFDYAFALRIGWLHSFVAPLLLPFLDFLQLMLFCCCWVCFSTFRTDARFILKTPSIEGNWRCDKSLIVQIINILRHWY